MAAASSSTSPQWLDLPEELLRRCFSNRDDLPCSRLVCRRLLALQLTGQPLRDAADTSRWASLRLCLDFSQAEDQATRRSTLVRVVQSFPSLKKLEVCIDKDPTEVVLGRLLASPSHMPGPAWLSNITDMSIIATVWDGVRFNTFVPGFLPPQLVRLKLGDVSLDLWDTNQLATRTHLKTLDLDEPIIRGDCRAVQQHLQALASLQQVKLATECLGDVCCLSSRINELEWLDMQWFDMTIPCPLLTRLNVPRACFTDTYVQSISVSMPSLQRLDVCAFSLSADFCTSPLPRLQTISIDGTTRGFHQVGVKRPESWEGLVSLYRFLSNSALLPQLSSVFYRGNLLDVSLSNCGKSAEADQQLAASVVSEVGRVGGLTREGGGQVTARFVIGRPRPPLVQQVLHSLVHMVKDLQSLTLQGQIQVSTALLASLGRLPSLTQLKIADYEHRGPEAICTVEDAIWEVMISSLPQVESLCLRCRNIAEAHVALLCGTAPRPIRVRVETRGFVPWTVGDFLQSVAHRHSVDLELA